MTPFEFIYFLGYSAKKRSVLRHQKKLPIKVVSIGNITVGGTGKTPAAIAVAEEAKKRGLSPIILTRGYRGKAKGPCLIQKTDNSLRITLHASRLFGDEPVLMAERLKDVPIVKCADRYEGGMFALETLQPSFFILDDGFQHWKLYRDVDIVLIDGSNPFGNRRMLPLGPLRGPLSELGKADMFVITKKHNGPLADELGKINPSAPVYFSEYRTSCLRYPNGNSLLSDSLKDKKVFAFCGIANPESFRQTVLSLKADLRGFMTFRDHYEYLSGDLSSLRKQCGALDCEVMITTEKDMVKLRGLNAPDNILSLEINFETGREFFDNLFLKISSGI